MKNTKIRKPLSILLAILMIAMTCSVAFGVSAEDETTTYAGLAATASGNCTGSYADDNVADGYDSVQWAYYQYIKTLVISGTGAMENYTKDSTTSIFGLDRPWYDYITEIETVIVEEGVTGTGTYAFRGCSALTSVSLPSSLVYIGAHLVFDCDALTSIVIPEGVVTIATAAFRDCAALEVISLPASVTSLAANQAIACDSLVLVAYAGSDWSDTNYLGNTAGAGYPDFIDSNVTTDDTSDDNVVTNLSLNTEYEIADSELTWSLSEDLTLTISGEGAMPTYTGTDQPWYALKTAIKSVVIEEGVTTVGAYSFYDFDNLTSVSIATTVTDIYNLSFWSTGLTSVAFPEGVVTIWNAAFRLCYDIETIYISSTVERIKDNAFGGVTNDGSFTAVYYRGTEAEYDLITISSSSNPGLYDKSTTIYYSHTCSGSYVSTLSSPTCTEVGIDLYACSTCGVTYQVEVASTGIHTLYTSNEAVAATCTTPGSTEEISCSVCEQVITASTTIAADGTSHTYDSGTVTAPTCTEQGYTTYKCVECGYSYVDTSSYVDATGIHTTYTSKEAVAATCEENGSTEEISCSVCNQVITASETIAATGHSYEAEDYEAPTDTTLDNYTAPTYTENGYWTVKCDYCDETKDFTHETSSTTYTIAQLELAVGEIAALTFTFGDDATEESIETAMETAIKAIADEYGMTYEISSVNIVLATTTMDGWASCVGKLSAGVDGLMRPFYIEQITLDEITVTQDQLNQVAEDIKAALADFEYSDIVDQYIKDELVDVIRDSIDGTIKYTYADVTTAAECEVAGSYTYTITLTVDDATATVTGELEIAALEHEWVISEQAVAATYAAAGKAAVETCELCGNTKGGEEIPKLVVTQTELDEVATAIETALENTTYSTEVETTIKAAVESAIKDIYDSTIKYTYAAETTAAECEKAGSYAYTITLSVDDATATVTDTLTITALEHEWKETAAEVAATYAETGKTAVETCSLCQAEKGGEEIAKLVVTQEQLDVVAEDIETALADTTYAEDIQITIKKAVDDILEDVYNGTITYIYGATEVEATCVKAGSFTYTLALSVDDATATVTDTLTIAIDSEAHKDSQISEVEVYPTCTENGYYYEYWDCCTTDEEVEALAAAAKAEANADGAEVEDDMKATGHSFDAADYVAPTDKTYDYTPATTEADGYWEIGCSNYGCDETKIFIDVGSKDALLADEQAQKDLAAAQAAATAVAAALATFTTTETTQAAIIEEISTVIAETLGEETTVSTAITTTGYESANCGENGYYSYTVKLTVGEQSATTEEATVTIAAFGEHTYPTATDLEDGTAEFVSYTKADATNDGYWTVKCSVCGTELTVTDEGSNEEFLADEKAQEDLAVAEAAAEKVAAALTEFTTTATTLTEIRAEIEAEIATAITDDDVKYAITLETYEAASCGATGSYTYQVTITVGEQTVTTESATITLAETGAHTFATAADLEKSGDNYTAATCISYDTWTNVKCANCDATTTVYGTTYGDCSFTYDLDTLTEDDTRYTPATAEANGYWTIKCDRCDKTTQVVNEGSQDAFIEAEKAAADLAAAEAAAEKVAAALTDFEITATSEDDIKAELSEAIEDETEVKYSIRVVEYKAPTCGAAGSYTYTVTITVGEQTATTQSATIALAETSAHTYETTTIASTCCTKGTITTTCTVEGCDYESVVYLNLDPTNHENAGTTEITKAATCTEAGSSTTTYDCCKTTVDNVIPATGHSFDQPSFELDVDNADYTDPTCTEDGYWTVECTYDDCEESTKIYDTGTGGHIDEDGDGVCDTCEEEIGSDGVLSVLLSFWQRIVDFFNSILSFFQNIGSLT